jgi:hypothetical protein
MDVDNALRLEELGLMPAQGGQAQTEHLLVSDSKANLTYMATMLAYADQLLLDFWAEHGMGTPPDQLRLELMARLQNGRIRSLERTLASLESEADFEEFREVILEDKNIPKILPWIEWGKSELRCE